MSSLESKGLYTINKAIRRTHSPRTSMLVLLGWAVICVGSPILCEEPSAGQERPIRIASAGGEPAFVLRISAEGRTGVVSVRDEQGAELQSLTCALLRDNTAPTDEELGALREQFVTQFEVKDFDFDHHADLAGIRGEVGAVLRVAIRPEATYFCEGLSGGAVGATHKPRCAWERRDFQFSYWTNRCLAGCVSHRGSGRKPTDAATGSGLFLFGGVNSGWRKAVSS